MIELYAPKREISREHSDCS